MGNACKDPVGWKQYWVREPRDRGASGQCQPAHWGALGQHWQLEEASAGRGGPGKRCG